MVYIHIYAIIYLSYIYIYIYIYIGINVCIGKISFSLLISIIQHFIINSVNQ